MNNDVYYLSEVKGKFESFGFCFGKDWYEVGCIIDLQSEKQRFGLDRHAGDIL